MKTKKKEKIIDAVKIMRDARKKISAETQNMNLEELKEYIDKQLKSNQLKPIGNNHSII
jgi:methionine aminopeptidase